MARKGYRTCIRCHKGRNTLRFVGTRGRICDTCRKAGRSTTTKDARLQETYGITMEEWQAILKDQGGVCAICGGKRKMYDVDHDHALAKAGLPIRQTIRGLLCKRCNRRLLPAATDSLVVLRMAIDYLINNRNHVQRILDGGA